MQFMLRGSTVAHQKSVVRKAHQYWSFASIYLRTASLLFLLITAQTALAQATSFPLLLMDGDARSAARGSMGVAVEFDGVNLSATPAALAQIVKSEAGFHFLNHPANMKVLSAQYATKKYAQMALALGVSRLDYGDLVGRDLDGTPTGSFSAGESLLQLSAAKALGPWQGGNLFLGARVGFLAASLDDASASALMASVGADWRRGGLAIGVQAKNFGHVLSDYASASVTLPEQLEIGLAHRLAHLPLTWSVAYLSIQDRDAEIRAGAEFLLAERWHLGFGLQFARVDERLVDVSGEGSRGLSAGLGGSIGGGYRFHWSWASLGELGAQNRFSLSRAF
jgi:hypothetical protein